MITVKVSKQSNYPVSSARLKKFLKDFFVKNGIVSEAEVSLVLVGEEKMLEIGKKYLKDKKLHNVLSFTQEEGDKGFVFPPGKIFLGEIIICYPQVMGEAKSENVRVEDKILELIEHGGEHLLGRHHS